MSALYALPFTGVTESTGFSMNIRAKNELQC